MIVLNYGKSDTINSTENYQMFNSSFSFCPSSISEVEIETPWQNSVIKILPPGQVSECSEPLQ